MASGEVRLPRLSKLLGAQIRYQTTLMARSGRGYLLAIILPAFMLTLLLKARTQGSEAVVTAQHLADISGIVVFGTFTITYINYATNLVTAREEGVLRRWHMAPLPAWVYFAGRIIVCVLLADCTGILLLIVGVILADFHLTATHVICLLIADTLGALTLATVGTAITAMATTIQSLSSITVFTYAPLLILSGAVGKLSLPQWVNTLMTYFPVQPVIQSVSRALGSSSGGLPLISPRDLVVLAAWAVGFLALSVRYFRWDPHRPSHALHVEGRTSVQVG